MPGMKCGIRFEWAWPGLTSCQDDYTPPTRSWDITPLNEETILGHMPLVSSCFGLNHVRAQKIPMENQWRSIFLNVLIQMNQFPTNSLKLLPHLIAVDKFWRRWFIAWEFVWTKSLPSALWSMCIAQNPPKMASNLFFEFKVISQDLCQWIYQQAWAGSRSHCAVIVTCVFSCFYCFVIGCFFGTVSHEFKTFHDAKMETVNECCIYIL